jgi:hypothetical protein
MHAFVLMRVSPATAACLPDRQLYNFKPQLPWLTQARIVGVIMLQLLPGPRYAAQAAAEPGGSGALPLLLAALVTGGPLLPYRVTKRAAVLLVCPVTCSNQGSIAINHDLKAPS